AGRLLLHRGDRELHHDHQFARSGAPSSAVALFAIARVDLAVPAVRAAMRATGRAASVRAVVLAVVTELVAGDDSVAAGALALRAHSRKPRERQLVIRLRGVAFGLEHGDLVHAALGK